MGWGGCVLSVLGGVGEDIFVGPVLLKNQGKELPLPATILAEVAGEYKISRDFVCPKEGGGNKGFKWGGRAVDG